ncbi:tannase/feruloyl esterase family alpha/beta hydrolase [Nocardia arthritidis]|uniref:Tannase/feruloyl esterase family alpha/beta hydrolase n=1 Tax=Nocardia arthritidis TaxID=228602 RepID=A0A6G9Y8R7_9NOCA|nr:tannase/feruloyl esterase family alpha/beta hydrolase [Nocardia arthritidis]QIS09609.1 tannase/feruloyl esterase family alpha/beta hydrolase [Nocardia arthritidis]
MPPSRHITTLAFTTVLLCGAGSANAEPQPENCSAPKVIGAEMQVAACLADLTTSGTVASGHTIAAEWDGLQPAETRNPTGVPGIQIDGYFPDNSTTNTDHGWNHDSQFVIRLPERWNGGLVVAGTPGNRRQYANDFTIADWVLARGYAYAATDKGNTGAAFFQGEAEPGDAMAEWNRRVTELTIAAQTTVAQRYGRPAAHTYVAGQSNGGYLVRWQLENVPWLYDGGIDWEGSLWQADGPNVLTFLPAALRNYPGSQHDPAARAGMLAAGFPAGSEPLWDYHYRNYWDLTQRIYRREFDPDYTATENPFCQSGTPGCDADYDYLSRPASVRAAMSKVALTGRIQRPLITVHGTLDALLPIAADSDVYAGMIRDQGRADLHRYYGVEGGNHTDGLYDAHRDLLRPLLPCFRTAFAALEGWITAGQEPPVSATVPRPATGDLANTCALDS